ncbi:MAG: 2Fe-2S iron-sulfur cluster binding domain-containing protein, partial [Myxococcales bacterium]|nr:2Fe-2S iron-sulfur cluster binding domain-containing protein [Myxococcales bacterium]
MTYSVRLQPVDIEMEVEEDETVLQAAFRQGITLMHGCKEGQCASCKSILLDGDAEHLDFSTFALSEPEQEEGHVLLCRLKAYSDLEIELLNYDEDTLTSWIPAKNLQGRVTAVEPLTHDIRRLEVSIDEGLSFRAGQFVDLTIPGTGVTRSYSMANPPSDPQRLAFIIKIYPDGAFSSRLAAGVLDAGASIELHGPFGMSFRDEAHDGPVLLVGGGSGMSPLWSILHDLAERAPHKPVRFYYGARAATDLFYADEIAAIGEKFSDFRFIPALSEPDPTDDWSGETGFIHEIVARDFGDAGAHADMEAYA